MLAARSYNAAHALALYALRRLGCRSDNRYLVFRRACVKTSRRLFGIGVPVIRQRYSKGASRLRVPWSADCEGT